MSDGLYDFRQIKAFSVHNARQMPDGEQVIILTFLEPDFADTTPCRYVMSVGAADVLTSQLVAATIDAGLFDEQWKGT